MKKIFYILFTASLLAVGCTKEIPVSRNHNLDAEVLDIESKMEMTTLYCNLNGTTTVDLQQLSEYLTAKSADVAMFVAPTVVGETNFNEWLAAYATEHGYNTLNANNDDGRLVMAALINADLTFEKYTIVQASSLNNAVLHFKSNDIHFVVTELLPARNAIPADWQDQVAQMTTDKKSSPLVYDPDNHELRKAELVYLINQTIDNKAHMRDANWMWAINMNAESYLDIVKYEREFLRADCYDDVTEEFLTTVTKYFSVSELVDQNDPYFALSKLLISSNMIDCNAVHHSLYTPSSVSVEEGEEGSRQNFLYATDVCWNMFRTFDFDTEVAAQLGVLHYPIIVSLKKEE